MRYVHRATQPKPTILQSRAAREFEAAVAHYLDSAERERRPPTPPPAVLQDGALREALLNLFEGACAYCETRFLAEEFSIDHYRPWGGADRADGNVDYQHYCWLGLEWANLYPACNACQRAKRNFFPIRVRDRESIDPRSSNLLKEGPLLLDPCSDNPSRHLMIGQDGSLSGLDDRGATTIDLLALNRPALREARLDLLRMLDIAPERPLSPSAGRARLVASAVADRIAFRGIIMLRLIQELSDDHPFRRWSRESLTPDRAARLVEAAVAQAAGTTTQRSGIDPTHVRTGERRYIRNIVIDNFRGIDHAVVEFPPRGAGNGKGAGSLAILGENAAGKTSLLQAAAIGAMGPTKAMEAGILPQWCLGERALRGKVGVTFYDTDDTNFVTFEASSDVLGGQEQVPVTVLGYGAYRLPARSKLGRRRRRMDFRVHTLMEERFSVNGPFGLERHFAGVDGRSGDAARALNAMLTEAATATIGSTGRLEIKEGIRTRRLTDLSSGFKSILSVGTDIMDVMYETWGGLSSAQAFVLIDEIDAHLHPEWRLRVVEAFRSAFPLSQFMITTHDPLVLRGVARQEIRVLDRLTDGSVTLTEPSIPSLDGLDVDQILTSNLFGLRTTLRPEVDRDLAAYYRLLAAPALDPNELGSLDVLTKRLHVSLPMGISRRERLLYAVIDRYLARSGPELDVDVWDEGAVLEILHEFEAAEEREDGDLA